MGVNRDNKDSAKALLEIEKALNNVTMSVTSGADELKKLLSSLTSFAKGLDKGLATVHGQNQVTQKEAVKRAMTDAPGNQPSNNVSNALKQIESNIAERNKQLLQLALNLSLLHSESGKSPTALDNQLDKVGKQLQGLIDQNNTLHEVFQLKMQVPFRAGQPLEGTTLNEMKQAAGGLDEKVQGLNNMVNKAKVAAKAEAGASVDSTNSKKRKAPEDISNREQPQHRGPKR